MDSETNENTIQENITEGEVNEFSITTSNDTNVISSHAITNISNDIAQNSTTKKETNIKNKNEEALSKTAASIYCPECNSQADNQQFIKSAFRPKNKHQVCWIYRYRCLKSGCAIWFGPYKRFDRNAFIEVDEVGRPLSRFRRNESHKTSDEKVECEGNIGEAEFSPSTSKCVELETSNVLIYEETCKNSTEEANVNKNENKGCNQESENHSIPKSLTTKKRRRRKGRLLMTKRKRSAAVVKTSAKNSVDPEITESATKNKRNRLPKGYAYVLEPIPNDDTNKAVEPDETQAIQSLRRSQNSKKNPDRIQINQAFNEHRKNAQKKESVSSATFSTESSITFADACVQTDKNLLLKSSFYDEMFNDAIREEFEPTIIIRLLDQSLILKKKFVMMANIIKEKKQQIENLRKNQTCYNQVLTKINEALKEIRLTYSDKLRRIKADVAEQADEFRQHHIEVVSMFRKTELKYAKLKGDMEGKYADMELKIARNAAELNKREKEVEYERERAEYFLWQKDKFEQMKNASDLISRETEEKLKDTLYIKGNEKCSHCQITERLKKKLTTEMADMTIEREKAFRDRKEFEIRTQKAERVAQILGQEVDKLNYEIRTWKSQIEKYKEQVNALNANIKELNEKTANSAKNTPRYGCDTPAQTKHSLLTPRSLSTPGSSEMERVSPPEDGEITEISPPGASPISNKASKSKIDNAKRNVQSKTEQTREQFDAGFSRWFQKDKIITTPPKVPRLMNAFGIPLKPKSKEDENNVCLPASSVPVPWEKQHLVSTGSTALIAAAAKLDAESFLGISSPSTTNINNCGTMDAESFERKKNNEEKEGDITIKGQEKRIITQKNCENADNSSPKTKKKKLNMIRQPNPITSTISSLSHMKKIPKHSDKPPPPELAKALGITKDGEEGSYKSIPGLSLLDEKNESTEYADPKKIQPAVNKKSNQTPPKHNPWGAPPHPEVSFNRPQNAFGIGTSPKVEQMDREGVRYSSWRDSGPSNRESFSYASSSQHQQSFQERSFGGSLPWHRTPSTPSFDSSFGVMKNPQESWVYPPQPNHPRNGGPWNRPSFFGRPPDSRPLFPPRPDMDRRSYWE